MWVLGAGCNLWQFADTVSRSWRAFQPALKQTTRSDCVQVSGVACSFQDSKSPVLNLQLSGDVQPTPGHLKWHQTGLRNWTEPLMLGRLSASLWQDWQTTTDYKPSTHSPFTRGQLHADVSVCLNPVKTYPGVAHCLGHSTTTAKCFSACVSHHLFPIFPRRTHRQHKQTQCLLSLALHKQAWGQALLCGLISVSSLLKKIRLSHWYKGSRTWALEEASPAESLTKLKESHNSALASWPQPLYKLIKKVKVSSCLLCPNCKQKRNVNASLNFIIKHMDLCYHGNKGNAHLLSSSGPYLQKQHVCSSVFSQQLHQTLDALSCASVW